jgi:UDP-glucose 4-epimerase
VEYQTLRIGHVYGPGEEAYKKIIPITISNAIKGKPVEIWGDGLDLRSFIYIDDVITAVVNAIEREPQADTVNVVSGNSINIKDLVASIIKVSGKGIDVTFKDSVAVSRNLVFDNNLLRSTLLETETDFMAGLAAEYNHMKTLHENNI